MNRMIVGVIGLAALGGCTGAHIKPAPVCDGKHRRPANLYGSVLPTLPVPLPASQSNAQSMAAPAPGADAPAAPPASPTPSPSPDAAPPATPGPGAMTTPPPAPRTSRQDVVHATASC